MVDGAWIKVTGLCFVVNYLQFRSFSICDLSVFLFVHVYSCLLLEQTNILIRQTEGNTLRQTTIWSNRQKDAECLIRQTGRETTQTSAKMNESAARHADRPADMHIDRQGDGLLGYSWGSVDLWW